MRKLLSLSIMAFLVLAVLPVVIAVSVGSGIGVDIETEDFEPRVFMCDSRLLFDDNTEPGRITEGGDLLFERMNNYAFEGEQIQWEVIVWDKNGIEKVKDVYVTLGSSQGDGNDIEVNCVLDKILEHRDSVSDSCNARELEESLDHFNDNTAAIYICTLTVETPESMEGEFWVTVEAEDLDGEFGTMDENEFWFFNPEIALGIIGDLTFDDVRPGTMSYSETLLIRNDAEAGSGVRLDMFISGTDFYDSSSSGAKCPVSNVLGLENFDYFATHGSYSTQIDGRSDAEGYVPIGYGVGFNDPNPFYGDGSLPDVDGYEILQTFPTNFGYYQSNILSPGSEVAMTFRLDLPEPCNGDFDTGQIFFWGEAI